MAYWDKYCIGNLFFMNDKIYLTKYPYPKKLEEFILIDNFDKLKNREPMQETWYSDEHVKFRKYYVGILGEFKDKIAYFRHSRGNKAYYRIINSLKQLKVEIIKHLLTY